MVDLVSVQRFAEDLAREAGEVLLTHGGVLPMSRVALKGRRDPVTEADVASERVIVAAIRERFPDHNIFAEEEVRDGVDGLTWYVDPLDGTVNFSQGHPFFGVSLALYDGDEPLVGVIHAPRLGETFSARRGGGCLLDGEPRRVSSKTALIDSMLATGFAYGRDELPDSNVGHFSDLILRVRGIRRCGSAALDLAYTAVGRLDGFWEPHLNSFDMAAGALLVREAGGVVTDMAGGGTWLHGRTVVAAGPDLHPVIVEALDTPDVEAVTGMPADGRPR